MRDYVRDGAEIYRRSFATIRTEADLRGFTPEQETIAVRMIHACGMTEITSRIEIHPDFVTAARNALSAGCAILCDARMVAEGVTRARLPARNDIVCTLDHPDTRAHAAAIGNTRSAAALEFWGDRMAGAVIAIGNAPTALFHLLDLIDAGAPAPAAIIGMPVGFIGAAESKQALAEFARIPFATIHGRLGGSAMTVAAVNAVASAQE